VCHLYKCYVQVVFVQIGYKKKNLVCVCVYMKEVLCALFFLDNCDL